MQGSEDCRHIGGPVAAGDLDRQDLGLRGHPDVGAARQLTGGGAVTRDDPRHHGAVAEGVVGAVVLTGEVRSGHHPTGQVGHRAHSGVEDSHSDAGARRTLGPGTAGAGGLRVGRGDGCPGVRRVAQLHGGVGCHGGDPAAVGQQAKLVDRHRGRDAVDDGQVAQDPAADRPDSSRGRGPTPRHGADEHPLHAGPPGRLRGQWRCRHRSRERGDGDRGSGKRQASPTDQLCQGVPRSARSLDRGCVTQRWHPVGPMATFRPDPLLRKARPIPNDERLSPELTID